jgi:hypothetical protein
MNHYCHYQIKPYLPSSELFINVSCVVHVDRVGKKTYILERPGYRPILLDEVPSGSKVQDIYDDIDKHCPLCSKQITDKEFKCPSCNWEHTYA